MEESIPPTNNVVFVGSFDASKFPDGLFNTQSEIPEPLGPWGWTTGAKLGCT